MHTRPPAMILLLRPFGPLFSKRVWLHVQVLLAGAILAPAQRTDRRRQGGLPRCGAEQPQPLRQGDRAALGRDTGAMPIAAATNWSVNRTSRSQ
jgi:hypothetical protein